ncbi:hypothetical protein C8J56DRAFT_1101486 [Mycena floridula]|nr:hypothetical protein C8J56DRAFT_1101486 [Mycena floridula]
MTMADFFIPTSADEFRAHTNASLTSSHARDSPQYTENVSQETPSQHFPAVTVQFVKEPTFTGFQAKADRDHTEPVISGASPVEMDQDEEIVCTRMVLHAGMVHEDSGATILSNAPFLRPVLTTKAERARALAAEVLPTFKDNEEAVVILVEREQVVFKLRELTRLSTMFQKMNWEPGAQVHVWRIMDSQHHHDINREASVHFSSSPSGAALHHSRMTQLPGLSLCPGFDTLPDLSRMATRGETGDRGRPPPVPNWASPSIPPLTPMSAYTFLPSSTTCSAYVIPDSSSDQRRSSLTVAMSDPFITRPGSASSLGGSNGCFLAIINSLVTSKKGNDASSNVKTMLCYKKHKGKCSYSSKSSLIHAPGLSINLSPSFLQGSIGKRAFSPYLSTKHVAVSVNTGYGTSTEARRDWSLCIERYGLDDVIKVVTFALLGSNPSMDDLIKKWYTRTQVLTKSRSGGVLDLDQELNCGHDKEEGAVGRRKHSERATGR